MKNRAMNRRRGVIFVTALGIIVILTGLALVFAQSMRTEALASANRRSQAEADAIELGAEQWVMAQVDAYQTDAATITQVPAEAIQVGTGYFWIQQFDADSDQTYMFGITDECGKLNINQVQNEQVWETLPSNLYETPDLVDAILGWTSGGGDNGVYESLPEPYQGKQAPYDTLEEILLVQSADGNKVTPQLLWGADLNRNGVLEENERQGSGYTGSYSGGTGAGIVDGRGIFNYLTAFSKRSGTTQTQGPARYVNINTASDVVLEALGMTQNGAESIITGRQGQAFETIQQAEGIVGQGPDAAVIQQYCKTQSSQYSADIVAVSGDGRAFRRVKIVVDGSSTPARIIYRKDMTSYGWPFPDSIRKQLMNGQGVQIGSVQQAANTGVTGH